MSNKYMILSMLLIFILTSGLSLGQTDNNTSAMENAAAAGNETAPGNATAASTGPNLNYIWSVTGIEAGPVTMVLNQEPEGVFGQAKYEPEGGQPWNGEVSGSIEGDKVELVLTALKGKDLVTTKMSGIFAAESITGNLTQTSGGKITYKGPFSAMWINDDTSAYTPAVIEEQKAVTQEASQTSSTTTEALGANFIEITSSSFQPDPLTVQMGTIVTWVNHDTKDQAIAATNGAFDSGNIVVGGQYQYTFSQPGTFGYYSKINPSMNGKVVVTSRFRDVREFKDKIGPGGDLSGVPPGMGGSMGA